MELGLIREVFGDFLNILATAPEAAVPVEASQGKSGCNEAKKHPGDMLPDASNSF